MSKALCKITGGGGKVYYVLTELHSGGQDGIDLSLCDGHSAWACTVSEIGLRKMAKKVKMVYEDYMSQSTKALTRENVGTINFQYIVKPVKNEIQFTWKKHMPSDNIKFELGSVQLEQCDDASEIIQMIFNHSIEATTVLQDQITSLQSDNNRLMAERATALKRLEKCVTAKEDMEKDLYSKFVTVVNDKKSKIRSLRDELQDAREGGPSSNSVKRPERELDSGGDESDEAMDQGDNRSDSEYETDEDNIKPSTSRTQPTARALKSRLSDAGDPSLLLDDGEEGDTLPTATKRRRRGGAGNTASKSKTPSKPVLPRVQTPTAQKTKPNRQSSSGRPSLKKAGSQTSDVSNKSSDNIDPDNLIEDI